MVFVGTTLQLLTKRAIAGETEQRVPVRTEKLTVEEDESGGCCHGRAAMLSAQNSQCFLLMCSPWLTVINFCI